MDSKKIKPQFIKKTNPRVGLIVLATDVMIEKDFLKVFSSVSADLFVNRITNYNPVTADNLKKELLEIAPSANEDYFLVPRVVE